MTPRFFSITVDNASSLATDLATAQVDCIVIRDKFTKGIKIYVVQLKEGKS